MAVHQYLQTWQLVDSEVDDAAVGTGAVAAALSRHRATLWYGSHCFEFTNTVDEDGACLLCLEEVGRRLANGPGAAVLIVTSNGYHDEQRIAPCRAPLDAITLHEIDSRALRAIGELLFADVARAMDSEERLA